MLLKIEINKPMNVLVKIAGQGNLDANKLPEIIQSDDYTFSNQKLRLNYLPTKMV